MRIAKRIGDGTYRRLAGDFAGSRSTHAIAHYKKPGFGAQSIGIFIGRTNTAHIGERGYFHEHLFLRHGEIAEPESEINRTLTKIHGPRNTPHPVLRAAKTRGWRIGQPQTG
jgi:hypothetical protein